MIAFFILTADSGRVFDGGDQSEENRVHTFILLKQFVYGMLIL